jgi:hypothetical protein
MEMRDIARLPINLIGFDHTAGWLGSRFSLLTVLPGSWRKAWQITVVVTGRLSTPG